MRKRFKLSRFDGVEPADFGVAALRAEKRLAQKMAADTEPFVPALTGAFARNTRVINNLIVYQGEQARYLYEGKRMVNAVSGKGPRLIPDLGYRWPKGAVLAPTSEPLTYTKKPHPKATDHWMEASEQENGQKWADFAEEALAHELGN